ncbi:ankyrin, partial [Neocallimastix sp. 'constans']
DQNEATKQEIISIIKRNKITELKNYINENKINLNQFNSKNFDILIIAIESNSSLEIIEFIIKQGQYKNLNYYIAEDFLKYKYPFFTALENNNFEIADFLLKNKADVNFYRRDVVNHLNSKKLLNNKNLKYLLSHGFNVTFLTPNSLYNLINNFQNDLLEIIFKYYKYDYSCILNLLNLYKNNKLYEERKLNNSKGSNSEKGKINVDEIMYKKALENNNYEALRIIFENESSEEHIILKRIIKYGLFEKAIKSKNYRFVKKILSYYPFNYRNINYEKIISETYHNDKNIWKLLIHSFIYTSDDKVNKKFKDTLNMKCDYDVRYLNLLLNIGIRKGDEALIKYLIESGEFKSNLNINARDINGEYPIITAFYADQPNIFKYLITHGANINSKNNNGMSLLLLSIYGENVGLIKYLLESPKILLYEKDINGNYPLLQAINQNNIEIVSIERNNFDIVFSLVNYGIKHNCNINKSNSKGEMPLVLSYSKSDKEIFKYLIKYLGVDKMCGTVLLGEAFKKNDIEMVNYLLSIGVDLNYEDLLSNSFFINSIGQVSFDILKILLERDHIALNNSNCFGETPLIKAIRSNKYTEEQKFYIVKRLLEKGSNVNSIDNSGRSPLVYAIDHKYTSIVKLLIKNGANIYIKSKDGKSLLENVINSGNYNNIKYLYQLGFNNYRVSAVSFNFFHQLIFQNELKLLKLLIDNNCNIDINMRDSGNGWTLLHYAIFYRDVEIVKYLLENGANPHTKYNLLHDAFDINNKNNKQYTDVYNTIQNLLLKSK